MVGEAFRFLVDCFLTLAGRRAREGNLEAGVVRAALASSPLGEGSPPLSPVSPFLEPRDARGLWAAFARTIFLGRSHSSIPGGQ